MRSGTINARELFLIEMRNNRNGFNIGRKKTVKVDFFFFSLLATIYYLIFGIQKKKKPF